MRVCVLFLIYYVIHIKCGEVKTGPTSGPYKVSMIRVGDCKKTTYPLDPNPSIRLSLEVFNSTRTNSLRGNMTVIREQKQIKIKMKTFVWQNSKWKMTYLMNNVGCHGLLLHMILSAVGINYNRENCMLITGQYTFKEIDVDTIQHIWVSNMEYGRMLWIVEVISRTITIYCSEFETLVEPRDKS